MQKRRWMGRCHPSHSRIVAAGGADLQCNDAKGGTHPWLQSAADSRSSPGAQWCQEKRIELSWSLLAHWTRRGGEDAAQRNKVKKVSPGTDLVVILNMHFPHCGVLYE